jgi:hypothetical protein
MLQEFVKLAQKRLGRRSTLFPTRKVHASRFAGPLFSYSYELLFPQFFCFDNHLSCPGVSPLCTLCPISVSSVLGLFPFWLTPYFQQLAASFFSLCRFFATSFLCFQQLAASFPETTRGWGYPLAFTVAARATVTFDFQLSDCQLPAPQC